MMQAGVVLRQDTETTLPELTEQHRIRQKEEELSGLESVHMAESETECDAPGLNTLEPECVTAHSGVSDVHHTRTSLIKTETDLDSIHSGGLIKTESLDSTELGYVTHLHPDQIKTETEDDGEYVSDLEDIDCVVVESDEMKFESSESLVSDVMDPAMTGADVGHSAQTEPWRSERERNPTSKIEEVHDLPTQRGNLNQHRDKHNGNATKTPSLLNLLRNGAIRQYEGDTPTNEAPYRCKQCEKCFKSKYYLNVHLRGHTGETPYKCPECGKFYKTKYTLIVHLRVHTGEKPHKCLQCEKCFSKKKQLYRHTMVHTGERPYTCPQCGEGFFKKHILNAHLRIHEIEKLCERFQPGDGISKISQFVCHEFAPESEKPFKCGLCEKRFNRTSDFNKHLRIHTGEKPFKCIQCQKSFCQSSQLNQHKRVHTGEKPCRCEKCEKCFQTSSSLNRHLRIHAGETPYRCALCGKCSCTKFDLNKHMRVHEGEKPHKCTQCDKCFVTKSSLVSHLRVHSDKKTQKSCTDL